MPWVVEQSKAKSSCEVCFRPIAKGEWRFGKNHGQRRWFHLRCAARGAPQMFPPFAKQVQALLGSQPDQSRPLTEVERAMVVNFDGKGLPVLADWLTSRGDPWGELITLRLSGEDALAVAHFDRHAESLLGDLDPWDVQWCDGVVSHARLEGKGPVLLKKLDTMLTHRTAARLDTLELVSKSVDAACLELLSKKAPPTLVWLSIFGAASGLERLHLPHLEQLRLEVNVEAVEGLLAATLPGLRSLVLRTRKPLRPAFLEKLVASPLFARLHHFEIDEGGPVGGTLDDAGLLVLLGAKTSHLKTTYIELAGRSLTEQQKALAQKKFTKTNAAFLANPPEEPEFDEF